VTAAVHRFEEIIGGRSYLIEAKAVSPDRWRAYIVRIPGVPTALAMNWRRRVRTAS